MRQCLALAEMELRKLRHDPTELATRALQPTLWLRGFRRGVHAHPGHPTTGQMRYLDFLAPGVLAQSVLFIANLLRHSGHLGAGSRNRPQTPGQPGAARGVGVGKALSGRRARPLAGSGGLPSFLVSGRRNQLAPAALAGVAVAILLGAATFSTFSLIIACIVRTRERFMGIGQVLTMPLFFASNAVYPIAIMPDWLKVAAHLNPLTYEVDAMRALMVQGGSSTFGLSFDFAVLLAATLGMAALASRLYANLAR